MGYFLWPKLLGDGAPSSPFSSSAPPSGEGAGLAACFAFISCGHPGRKQTKMRGFHATPNSCTRVPFTSVLLYLHSWTQGDECFALYAIDALMTHAPVDASSK